MYNSFIVCVEQWWNVMKYKYFVTVLGFNFHVSVLKQIWFSVLFTLLQYI